MIILILVRYSVPSCQTNKAARYAKAYHRAESVKLTAKQTVQYIPVSKFATGVRAISLAVDSCCHQRNNDSWMEVDPSDINDQRQTSQAKKYQDRPAIPTPNKPKKERLREKFITQTCSLCYDACISCCDRLCNARACCKVLGMVIVI